MNLTLEKLTTEIIYNTKYIAFFYWMSIFKINIQYKY